MTPLAKPIILALFLILPGTTPLLAQPSEPPASQAPGPLHGGENGDTYRGPGFSFYLPAGLTVELDEVPPGEGARGERGTASGFPRYRGGDTEVRVRFEPYPLLPGGRTTLANFEAHIRGTLAFGVPVSSRPLIPPMLGHGGRPARADEPDGLQILFSRSETDAHGAAVLRRYFVYAYPREDGRVQSLVCSHVGRPPNHQSAIFWGLGSSLCMERPDRGGLFERRDLGLAIDCPPGWRFRVYGSCGSEWMRPEEERRRSPQPIGSFLLGSIFAADDVTAVDLSVIEQHRGPAQHLYRRHAPQGGAFRDFTFADGAVGRVAEDASHLVAFRAEGERYLVLQARWVRASERDDALAFIRGVRLCAPEAPPRISRRPSHYTAEGVTLTCPGDWYLSHESVLRRPSRPLLDGTFTPIPDPPPVPPSAHPHPPEPPRLNMAVQRLDDVLAELRQLGQATLHERQQDLTHEQRPLVTESGWEGWQWTTTATSRGRRGKTTHRAVCYVLPLPDGVMALMLTGSTNSRSGGVRSPDEIEKVWNGIARSARLAAPRDEAPGPRDDVSAE